MVSVLQPYTKLMKVLTEVQGLLVYRTANLDPVKKGFFFCMGIPTFFLSGLLLQTSFLLSFFHNCQTTAASGLHAIVGEEKEFKQDDGGMKPQVLRT